MVIHNKDDGSGMVTVRRRNPQGSETELVSASIPRELNKKINAKVLKTGKSKSLIITELIEKGISNE